MTVDPQPPPPTMVLERAQGVLSRVTVLLSSLGQQVIPWTSTGRHQRGAVLLLALGELSQVPEQLAPASGNNQHRA